MTPSTIAVTGDNRGAEGVDIAFLSALTLLALVGFKASYAGWAFFALGAFGLALGIALASLSRRLEQPLVVVAALTVLLFFVVGSVSAPHDAYAGFLPSANSIQEMAKAVIEGWKELLTTYRPVGTTGALLCIPYLLGLLAGVIGHTAARRTSITTLALLPPVGVLALGILFGTRHPQSLVLQGSCFAAVAIGWAAARARRGKIAGETQHRGLGSRVAAAAGLLAAAGGLSLVVGPALPFANANSREVLRTQPPVDPGAYPSPLSGFRLYRSPTTPTSRYDKPLFRVATPVPAGARLRIATMDSYNDVAWGVADETSAGSDLPGFARVGSNIPQDEPGPKAQLSIAIEPGYSGVWVPTGGSLSTIHFGGARTDELAASLRYDAVNDTAVAPVGLHEGDSITETVTSLPTLDLDQLSKATPARSPDLATSVYGPLATIAQRWARQASDPAVATANIASYLYKNGRYSDGNDHTNTLAGNSLGRLVTFTQGQQIAGNDEQYAATMALMANAMGMPARVVLGAEIPPTGLVEGKDIEAWVELDIAGAGWSILPPYTTYENRNHKALPQPKAPVREEATRPVPPPVNAPPASRSQDPNNASAPAPKSPPRHHRGLHVPGFIVALLRDVGIPLLVIAGLASLIIGAKLQRRRRRRHRGTPSARIAAGWLEVLDTAGDLGIRVGVRDTRREQASAINPPALLPLARSADVATFAPLAPSEVEAAQFWKALMLAVERLRTQASWQRRIYAMVNTRSLYSGALRALRARRRPA
ncbi:MAG TPA: transglutaminase-like domain-containing protein [Mycobacteriales bacterium]|nr:transglutaminase-like domain-containing protein [Mycobacteriales bacterium]